MRTTTTLAALGLAATLGGVLTLAVTSLPADAQQVQITITPRAQPRALHIYRRACRDGFCEAVLEADSASSSPTVNIKPWRERVRVRLPDVAAVLAGACALDDTARPADFPNPIPPCPVDDAGPAQ